MKNNSQNLLAFFFTFLLISISCSDKQSIKNNPIASADSSKVKNTVIVDTLKLISGEIPEGWKKVSLEKGYYIAFPNKPKKKEIKDKKRVELHYPQKKIDYYVSLTDLEIEPAFKENKSKKELFFEAVIDELIKDLEDTDVKQNLQVNKKEYFLFQNIYEAVKLELKANDLHAFVEFIIIGKTLHTIAVMIWEDENEKVLSDKNKFFNSLSKELQVN